MRAASLARLGIKKGHHRLYGVDVPDAIYSRVKRLVIPVRNQHGVKVAGEFAAVLVAAPALLDNDVPPRLVCVQRTSGMQTVKAKSWFSPVDSNHGLWCQRPASCR